MALGITKDQAGVDALRQFANQLLEQQEAINQASDRLKAKYDQLQNELAHEQEIEEILEDIAVTQSNVASSLATLHQKLNKVATQLEDFLNGGLGGSGN